MHVEQNKKRISGKSIVWEFFSVVATVLLCGVALMCAVETALSMEYFARERYTALTAVLDGAEALANNFAGRGYTLTQPDKANAEDENARSGLSIFETATSAMIMVADDEGNVVMTSNPEALSGRALPTALLQKLNETDDDRFWKGNLDGFYTDRYYTVARKINLNGFSGYLFAATSMTELRGYMTDMLSMFILSAGLMLLFSSVLSIFFARRLSAPIEQMSAAARKLGGGDFTARAPVSGCNELADFATTFNNMAARLQTIDNSRGQFMGNIAHELRTPMTSIKGFIDGMRDGTIPPEDHAHYLEIVSQETGRLARLVQNMLDITRLEAGEYQVHARDYDLAGTLAGVVLADEQRIEDGGIDIEGLSGDHMPVYADPDLVHQVVYNIVDNAIKFTPRGGVIRFAVKKNGGTVETSIENTGAGISQESLPYVFERFYKEDRSRGLNTRGSGLGLHICKVLVELSGGSIRVESEQGKWCRFTFTLPAGQRPEGRRGRAVKPEQPTRNKKTGKSGNKKSKP